MRHSWTAGRSELTVTAEELRQSAAFVAETGGQISGFYAFSHLDDEEVDLEYLFVAPEMLRQGVGQALMAHALCVAARLGYRRIVIVGDPHAEPFYLAMGARYVGKTPSASIPGRELPTFHVDLSSDR